MLKKFIFLIGFMFLIVSNFYNKTAEAKDLIPIKRPKLSIQELKEKVLVNILKPLPKPKKINKENQIKEVVKKDSIKQFFENFKATVEGTALPEKEKKGWFKK